MEQTSFEKLVSRNVVRFLSSELDMAGVKTSVNTLLAIMIIGGFAVFILTPVLLILLLKVNPAISGVAGLLLATFFELSIYLVLELRIEQRRTYVDSILPDYIQIVSANIRSGISLDKAMLLAARPEFTYFSDDVKLINRELYAGETIQNALTLLSTKYRSFQLRHTIRMMTEALQYGGGMTDLLNQIAKDIRQQLIIQKEISGQLFMYTIFIAFAGLIGAPVLYGLTTQMITITDTVWAGILKQNPGGLPTTGISFLRPSPPQVTIAGYHDFALAAVLTIAGFGAFIVSAISTGSVPKGIRYLPLFLIIALSVYLIVGAIMGNLFTTLSTV